MSTDLARPLAGRPAARVIRALLDFRSVWTTHDLVTTSQIPAQTVRRVIGQLEQEALVERRAPGVIAVPNWFALLRRWSDDVRFTRDAQLTCWRAKAGIQALLDHIPATPVSHSISGVRAAQHWARDTPAGPTIIYTPNARAAAAAWDLIPATSRSIILAEPPSDVVYARPRKTPTGLRLAAPAQVLTDLLTGAAASPTAAHPLLTWMQDNELQWRY